MVLGGWVGGWVGEYVLVRVCLCVCSVLCCVVVCLSGCVLCVVSLRIKWSSTASPENVLFSISKGFFL